MGGIAGFWGPPERRLLEAMRAVIPRGGAEDGGLFERGSVSLACRRSGTDRHPDRQPAADDAGTLHAVLAGEIHNRHDLQGELIQRGHTFRTDAAADLALHAYQEYGPECFARFNGTWALAIADLRGERPRLVLGRDQFGVEPLYYTTSGGHLLFGSVIRSILQDPSLKPTPNDRLIHEYLVHGVCDDTRLSFFEGVQRLPAAHYAVVDDSGYEEHAYWRPRLSSDGDVDPAVFRELLRTAIARWLPAGEPVGAGLSGGRSSVLMAHLASDLVRERTPDVPSSGAGLQTFSAASDDDSAAGRNGVGRMPADVGAERHVVHPAAAGFMDELTAFIGHQEEPTVTPNSFARWCEMRQAATRVDVLLDGQGGDELLPDATGEQRRCLRRLWGERRYRDLAREGWAARRTLAPVLRGSLAETRDRTQARTLLGEGFRDEVLAAEARWPAEEEPRTRLLRDLGRHRLPPRYEEEGNDTTSSVTSRRPYLDPELVEWVLRLPPSQIIQGTLRRAVLREGSEGPPPARPFRPGRKQARISAPETAWLKIRRAQVQSLFRSPDFCRRRYWNGLAVAEAFAAACMGKGGRVAVFWRVVAVELWLRLFFDQGTEEPTRPPTSEEVPEGKGDGSLARRFRPNRGKQLAIVGRDGTAYVRVPVSTRNVWPGDDLEAVIREALSALGGDLRPGDLLAVGEKIVAISQGRAVPLDQVKVGALARFFSQFVTRTPIGIGFRLPGALQLAIQEAGAWRILAAIAAAAVTRPFGIRGAFYLVAGRDITAIDSPVPNALPPSDTHVKLAPIAPDKVSEDLAGLLSELAGGRVEVAVIDANDIGAEVLGASAGVDRELLVSVLRDNPLGQGSERTPLALIRRDSAPAAVRGTA